MFYTNGVEVSFREQERFRIHGRTVTEEASLLLPWSNSGISLEVRGSRLEIEFAPYVAEAPVFVKVFFDGRAQRFGLNGAATRILIDFERDTRHSVKILRISEGELPLAFKLIRVYGRDPEVLPPPEEKRLKLEFLGDSITTGWGVMAQPTQNCYNTYEQDSTRSYAYMTGELLDAEIRTEAIGGQGVWRTCGKCGIQFKHMFDMSLRGREDYDHSTWIPDVVVLHCGTNDEPGGTDEETMYREANILIDKVHSAYPDAKIVWTYGMMNSKFHPTFKRVAADRRRAGDKWVHYLPIKLIYTMNNEVGAVGHPNVNASVRVSKKLASFIKRIL